MKKILLTSALAIPTFFGLASTANAYGDLSLINAISDQTVDAPNFAFKSYDTYLTGNQINFSYNSAPETQSVRFIVTDYSGQMIADRVENQAPFAAFGDNNGDFSAYAVGNEILVIQVQAYSEKFAQGTLTDDTSFITQFYRSQSPTTNTGLSIINADSNTSVASIANGQTFSFADIGSNLNLVAEFGTLEDEIGSVVFDQFNGDNNEQNIENVAPFALYGDKNGNFKGQEFSAGTFSVRVRAYTESNGAGDELANITYVFNLTE